MKLFGEKMSQESLQIVVDAMMFWDEFGAKNIESTIKSRVTFDKSHHLRRVRGNNYEAHHGGLVMRLVDRSLQRLKKLGMIKLLPCKRRWKWVGGPKTVQSVNHTAEKM